MIARVVENLAHQTASSAMQKCGSEGQNNVPTKDLYSKREPWHFAPKDLSFGAKARQIRQTNCLQIAYNSTGAKKNTNATFFCRGVRWRHLWVKKLTPTCFKRHDTTWIDWPKSWQIPLQLPSACRVKRGSIWSDLSPCGRSNIANHCTGGSKLAPINV